MLVPSFVRADNSSAGVVRAGAGLVEHNVLAAQFGLRRREGQRLGDLEDAAQLTDPYRLCTGIAGVGPPWLFEEDGRAVGRDPEAAD